MNVNGMIRSLGCSLLALFGLSNAISFAAVGRTPGAFTVSPTGAATYTIPIWAPPGPHGLQPHIAVVYSSQRGSGVMGPGWAIAGLSAITRCNRTFAQDSVPSPVTLTYSDAFCLDGKRLRLTSGTYGQDPSTYQTEIADFSNTAAHGTTGNGPSSFTVQGKDGLTYEYGVGGNSQVMAGVTVAAWMLDKVTDRAGNTMVIAYVAPGSTLTGTTIPSSISWTPVTHGASSYSYTMNFDYNGTNTSASSIFGYLAGNQVVNQDLLLDINIVNSAAATIKKYVFTYDSSPTTGATRLHQVKECADSAASDCLLPTVINHQDGSPGLSTTATSGPTGATSCCVWSHFDLNADGYPDLVYSDATNIWVAFGSASGYGTPVNTTISRANMGTLGDLLGTGKDGILANNGGTCYYYTWNSGSFSGVSTGVSACGMLADVDGDGLPDLVTNQVILTDPGTNTYALHIQTHLNTSNGGTVSFNPTTNDSTILSCVCNFVISDPARNTGALRAWDFNGDGRQDLAMTVQAIVGTHETTGYWELISNGTNFGPGSIGSTSTSSPPPPVFVNWNNDACTDVIWNGRLQLSGCNGTSPAFIPFTSATVLAALDWDGDGRMDVLVANGSTVGVYLSTGSTLSPTLQATSISYYAGCVYFVTDADADGQADLGCWNTVAGTLSYYVHNGAGTPPDLVSSIVDGYNNSLTTSYAAITRSNYANATDATTGYKNYIGSMYVVGQATFSDPSSASGGTYNQQFSYSGAWVSLQGRGFMGFYSLKALDSRTGLSDTRYFERAFPYAGMQFQEDLSNGSFNISHALGTPAVTHLDSTANNQRDFPYFSDWTVTRKELGGAENGVVISTALTTHTYDLWGNTTNMAETVTDNDPGSPYAGQQWSTTTVTSISEDSSSNWCLTQPTQVAITKTSPGSSVTRTVSFAPDYGHCRPTSKTTEPNSSAYALTEAYSYDDYGNLSDVNVSGVGVAARNTHTDWGTTTGQFPKSVRNALSQTTQYTYDANFGFRTSVQDPNLIMLSWTDDEFGRKKSEARPDRTSIQWTYTDCASSGGCLVGTHGVVIAETAYNVDQTVQSDAKAYLDSVDRPLVSSKRMLANGAYDRNEVRYDSLGRVAQHSMPCTFTSLSTPCPYWTTNTYDVLNRITQSQRPISAANGTLQTSTVQYAGRTTTTTDPQGMQSARIVTVAGTLGQSIDHDGYYQKFTYDGFGSLLSVVDRYSNTLFTADYDYGIGAFQRDATDADLDVSTTSGQHRHYTYDALGELTNWSDAKGQNFSESYDLLSRPQVRTEPDLTTSWTWDGLATDYNLGKLRSVSANSYSESYAYDSAGRISARFVTIPSDGTYEFDWAYNGNTGLLDTLTYPVSTSSYRLKLQYGYQNGLLQAVTDSNAGTVYWQANSANARGQITQETVGGNIVTNRSFDDVTGWMGSITTGVSGRVDLQNDSYLFDEVGNVTQRQSNNAGLTENFCYDHLYRLDHSTLNSSNCTSNINLQMHYDANGMGNIASRSDLAGGATWTYDPNRKHAVTQAGSPGYTYTYDNNGNVTSRNGYAVTWTSYNHPNVINAAGETVSFAYKPDHTRWSAIYSGSSGVETTYFIGDLVEKVVTAGSNDFRHFIYAGGAKVAIYSRTSAGANTLHYVREDHLGGVSGLVNTDGTSYAKESFTAFGVRRSTCTWSGPPTAGNLQAINAVTRHGFTWQTALGSMGLNDMNGRIQDAVTGRFLSPDPTIPDPAFTQSYNRYSYVNNNPLSFTDPSGFDEDQPQPYFQQEGGETSGSVDENVVVVSAEVPGGDQFSDGPSGSQVVGDVPPSQCSVLGCESSTQVCSGGSCSTTQHWYPNEPNPYRNLFGLLPGTGPTGYIDGGSNGGAAGRGGTAPVQGGAQAPIAAWSLSSFIFDSFIEPAFGWIDCAGGRCSEAEQARRLGAAALMILPIPGGPADGAVAEEAVNVVYRSVSAAGEVQYVGITNNLARRAAEQLADKGIQIEKLMGDLSRSDARAVEQALIEIHGLGRDGGTLINRINSIATSNPAYAGQIQRGYELLQSIGY
jgi:RHS repeat-associated protein